MKDRKTRTEEIRQQARDERRLVFKQFWKRADGHGYWGEASVLLTEEREEELEKELEEIYERNGYNEIYKQHLMAYRIINRWKSARVNPNTPLGKKIADSFADDYEEGIKK